ncbi:hypothetical protein [Mammaliicoccus sciuri]|uniref:hypothetical protein n=1 Tax=Mammaliicoccus sciuri TaxID=1296 RepID=UPI002DB92CCA|nr:hypothetical protein [Mammaliicoccus sciuri]MEB6292229.1 hypothetical protein [Mammaliicoccus sciuri]
MPTIKTKKEMNLPELIEWGWKNEIKERSFISNDDKVTANFEDMGRFIADNFISSDVTFTVEIEEEITEDTEIKGLVELGNDGHGTDFFQCNGSSINEQKDFDSEAFYILNDDKTMTLIWTKEKGLVE